MSRVAGIAQAILEMKPVVYGYFAVTALWVEAMAPRLRHLTLLPSLARHRLCLAESLGDRHHGAGQWCGDRHKPGEDETAQAKRSACT